MIAHIGFTNLGALSYHKLCRKRVIEERRIDFVMCKHKQSQD